MVTKFTYQITFLNAARYNAPPRFLIIRKLYDHIKRLTCLNNERICQGCDLSSKCVFHLLSGADFRYYPAILIRRDLIEKSAFAPKDTIPLTFFLIGNDHFKGYINGFFEQLNSLMGFPLRCVKLETLTLESREKQKTKCRIMTPLVSSSLSEQADYYRTAYETNLPIGQHSALEQARAVYDKRRYTIDHKTIACSGVIGTIAFDSIDSRYLDLGIGKSNFIGGGQLIEIED